MENKYNNCLKIVLEIVENYSKEAEISLELIDEKTRLIGSSSKFDSMDLVQIIVEIEERINEYYKCEIILTDEKAMSRTTSPFINIKTLTEFILENIN